MLWSRFMENMRSIQYAKLWMSTVVHFTTICYETSVKMPGLRSADKSIAK